MQVLKLFKSSKDTGLPILVIPLYRFPDKDFPATVLAIENRRYNEPFFCTKVEVTLTGFIFEIREGETIRVSEWLEWANRYKANYIRTTAPVFAPSSTTTWPGIVSTVTGEKVLLNVYYFNPWIEVL